MNRRILLVIAVCPVLGSGCGETTEADLSLGETSRVVRVSLTSDVAMKDLRVTVDAMPVETDADDWPPALPLPQSAHDLSVAFHATDNLSFEQVQPVLRQLATHERTARLILLAKPDTPAANWHWSQDVDLLAGAWIAAAGDDIQLPDIKVRLVAEPAGAIHMTFGNADLGEMPAACKRLNVEMSKLVIVGDPLTKELIIDLEATPDTPWNHIRFTLLACSGKKSGNDLVRYIERFKVRGITSELPV